MTIADVAAVLGIAPSTLTAYELGSRTPRDGVKEKIADYYGKSVSAFFLTKFVTNRDKRGANGMYALMQYIRDYIRSHPDEYQEWLKKKGEDKHE